MAKQPTQPAQQAQTRKAKIKKFLIIVSCLALALVSLEVHALFALRGGNSLALCLALAPAVWLSLYMAIRKNKAPRLFMIVALFNVLYLAGMFLEDFFGLKILSSMETPATWPLFALGHLFTMGMVLYAAWAVWDIKFQRPAWLQKSKTIPSSAASLPPLKVVKPKP